MYKKTVIIANPSSGRSQSAFLDNAIKQLQASGIDASLTLTGQRGDATTIARTHAGSPDTLVIAAGGDGTYNEVANGLAGSSTPMAILPFGTTSVLAHELNIPLNPKKALAIAISGIARTVHLGIIEREGARRHFLLMAGIGYDGESVYRVDQKLKQRIGQGAYFFSGIRTLLSYDPSQLSIKASLVPADEETAGSVIELSGYAVIISKAACYGGSHRISAHASLFDPSLHVFVTHRSDRIHMVRTLAAIMTGRVTGLDAVSRFRATALTVTGKAHIQIDGDYEGACPASFSVARNALRLVMPA